MDMKQRLGQIVVWGAGATTLLVTPFFSYDPINVPRFVALFFFGLMGFFLLLIARKQWLSTKYRGVVGVSVFFIIWGLIATFVSGINLNEGLFGVTGRQTGLLAYFALIALMISGVVGSSEALSRKLALTLVSIGILSGLYGVLQSFGGDPFDWINPYSPVFGFFGNPNFQASFMGIAAVAAIAMSLESSAKLQNRIG
jgi:drug/metabolite transporter (DMT)-like permease